MLPVKTIYKLNKNYNVSTIYYNLDGLVNIFKPSGMKWTRVKNAVLHNISKDLNNIYLNETGETIETGECKQKFLTSENATTSTLSTIKNLKQLKQLELLKTGPRYEIQDFRCNAVTRLGPYTSGVLILGLGDGVKLCKKMQLYKKLRAYHITGQLGIATEDHFPDSRITVKAKFRHVNADRLSYLASSVQASHQRKFYELNGIDPQSQTAYEIASKGLIYTMGASQPMIYSVKLIAFNAPNFTLEVHSINETENYLAALIHDMAIEMKTVAHCISIRCIRHGKFTIGDALLRHNWTISGVLQNIKKNKNLT